MNAYIICPPSIATGGPEYCHQICSALNTYPNINARIAYYPQIDNKFIKEGKPLQVPAYTQLYKNQYVVNYAPQPDDICFFPEARFLLAMTPYFRHVKYKFFIWMSVNNYLSSTPPNFLNFFPSNFYHVYPSTYAKDYLLNFAKINPDKLFYMGDAPSSLFFQQADKEKKQKENIITLQPGKCFLAENIIQELKKREKDYQIVLLKGMSTEQVIDTLKRSKVFLHLSYNPGLERGQQEAVLLDNCVIQSTLGCAKYYEDVPIPSQYKFDLVEGWITKKIVDKIEDCIENYDKCIDDFKYFKNIVWKRKQEFKEGIENIVKFIEEQENK